MNLEFLPDSALVAETRASPNHGERRGHGHPDYLVLHYTGMPSAESAIALLCNPASEVSAHYVIEETGIILQLVPEARRAWHAGVSVWKGERDLNSNSIGIEIVNPGHDGGVPDFPDAQIEATIALCRDICVRNKIGSECVLAHSDVAPARKRDPGERFPWGKLAAAGLGRWTTPFPISGGPLYRPAEEGPSVRAIQALLALFGFGLELTGVYDKATENVVAAFQRHFRPERIDGLADASTLATLRELLAAPVT